MNIFKARGIVLKEYLVSDYDKSLIVLLKDYGKLNIWAKNCRLPKSKIMAGTSIFCYCDFIIYDSGKSLSINQIDIIESFYNLTENLDSLAYGTYFLELVEKNTEDNISLNDIMLLLLKSLIILTKSKNITPKLISKIFELKFLQLNGYSPILDNCSICLNEIGSSNIFIGKTGVVCSKCKLKEKNLVKINDKLIYVMNYILTSNFNNLYKFNISNELLDLLSVTNKLLLQEHLFTELKTKKFIDEIEELLLKDPNTT